MNDKLDNILENLIKKCVELGIVIGSNDNNYDCYETTMIKDNAKKEILEYFSCDIRALKFINHIEDHFKHEHPSWHVKCKICDKTINEICDNDGYPYVGVDDSAKEINNGNKI